MFTLKGGGGNPAFLGCACFVRCRRVISVLMSCSFQTAPDVVTSQMGCSGSRQRVRASSATCQSRTLAAVQTLRRSGLVSVEGTINCCCPKRNKFK